MFLGGLKSDLIYLIAIDIKKQMENRKEIVGLLSLLDSVPEGDSHFGESVQ